MSLPARLVFALVVGLSGLDAAASHITDRLLAGLYAEPTATAQPLQLLPSGTPLEVLERGAGFQKVRLGDGTEGWVEARYVTEEKPAKAVLLETQARLAQLEAQLAGADRSTCPEPNDAGALPAGDMPRPSTAAASAGHSASGWREHWPWIGLGGGLVLGFVAGAALVAYRQRRRHGGFRV